MNVAVEMVKVPSMVVAREQVLDDLVSICRHSLDPATVIGSRHVDTELLLLSITNKVESVVKRAVAATAVTLSDDARVQLKQFEAFKRQKNSCAISSVLVAQNAMASNKVECVHFKGPVLQWLLYQDPFYRVTVDADLLVHPKDFAGASDALVSGGLKRRHHGNGYWWEHFLHELHFENQEFGYNVDLHKGIKQPGIPRFEDVEGVLQRSSSFTFLGANLKIPSLSDLYAILLVNFAKALLNRQASISYVLDTLRLASLSQAQENAAAVRSLPTSLEPVLRLCIHCAAVLFGQVKTLDEWTAPQGLAISDRQLRAAIFPNLFEESELPRRRDLLKLFHAGHPASYLHEVLNLASSEVFRRSTDS